MRVERIEPKAEEVALAFSKQALSEFAMYDMLVRDSSLPKSHRLHYLQMAAEKACKAQLYREQSGTFREHRNHSVIEKVLSNVCRQPSRRLSGRIKRNVRTFAYQLDRLAPAVDDESRPDNTEYPWFGPDGRVYTPIEYSFPELSDQSREFIDTLKLLREIALGQSKLA